MKTVVITEPIHEAGLAVLKARPDIELIQGKGLSPAALADALMRAHGIGVRTFKLDRATLARSNALAVVAKHGVGCDNIDVAHCTDRRIPVAITASANKVAVAEHVLTFILMIAKDPVAYDRATRGGDWGFRTSLKAYEIDGRTLLIVGFGRIGREVALRARAFGMRVLVADIAMDHALAKSLGCVVVEDFRKHLPKADFLTVHVPKTPVTAGFIGAAEIAAMKRGAVIINCARGGLVAEMALADALRSGHIAAAGLDVFDDEPIAKDHPFLKLPNLILSPHSAGSSFEAGRRMAVDTAQNILDALDGKLVPENTFNLAELAAAASRSHP